MLRLSRKSTLLSVCAAGAMLAGMATAAQAQVNIFGGGSTLASIVYPQEFGLYNALQAPLTTFHYTADGSGAGQSAFLTNNPSTHGFPAGTTIAFGASDATLSTTQINNFNADAVNGSPVTGPLIQIPTFATPVTVAFNTKQAANGQIQFTDAQLCGIFSGKITTWNDAALGGGVLYNAATNPSGVATRGTPPTGTIFVKYRTDGSGTTFLLTQHLAAVCNASNSNITFTANKAFANLFPGATPPANFAGASGSQSVSTAISGTPNSLGYLSPDFTRIASANAGITTFPLVASVKNGPSYLLPTFANTSLALANVLVPSSKADISDPTKFVPAAAVPTSGYPIAGFTSMILGQCYKDNNVGNELFNFLLTYYGGGQYADNLNRAGFALLPATLAQAITDNLLNNNNGFNLDIQDIAVCQAAGASGAGTFAGR